MSFAVSEGVEEAIGIHQSPPKWLQSSAQVILISLRLKMVSPMPARPYRIRLAAPDHVSNGEHFSLFDRFNPFQNPFVCKEIKGP